MTDVYAIFATNNKFMAKNSTRRGTICINSKESEASVIFGFFVFSPPPKPLPMNRCQPYRPVHPLTGNQTPFLTINCYI